MERRAEVTCGGHLTNDPGRMKGVVPASIVDELEGIARRRPQRSAFKKRT